jgi:hypothetical protein
MNNITLTVLVICLAVNTFLFFYFNWMIKRRTSASGLLAEHKKEVERLIADIDDATDRDSLLVEDRIRKLKEIIEDADKRIAVYLRELDKSKSGEVLYTNLGRGIRAALKEGESASVQTQAQAAPMLSTVRPDVIEIGTRPAPQQAPQPPAQQTLPFVNEPQPPAEPPDNPPSRRQIRAQIDELANEGYTAEQIASRLGISIAEVDLALTLSMKKS